MDTIVRFGDEVFAPITDPGGADHLVAFEMTEAARRLPYLKAEGRLLVNRRIIDPLPVLIGTHPGSPGLEAILKKEGAIFIEAEALACEAGSPRSANIVLMGALSTGLDFSVRIWHEVITSRVPASSLEANLHAFELGRLACEQGACGA